MMSVWQARIRGRMISTRVKRSPPPLADQVRISRQRRLFLVRWRLILQLLSASSAGSLCLNIGPRAQVLLEVADGAGDELIFLVVHWDQRHEADGEEGPLGDTARRPVAAVMALSRHILVALQLAAEVWTKGEIMLAK